MGKGCPYWPPVRGEAVASLEDPGKGFERVIMINGEPGSSVTQIKVFLCQLLDLWDDQGGSQTL